MQNRFWRWIVVGHIASLILFASTSAGVALQLPIIARKTFNATDYQTLLITAAPAVLLVLSIFWTGLLRRVSVPRYLAVYWFVALAPMLVIAWATPREGGHGFWIFAGAYVICCIGAGMWAPVNGELLKALYPDRSRGLIYGVIITCTAVGTGLIGFVLGRWLDHDPQAFRVFIPLFTGLQVLGLTLLCVVAGLGGGIAQRSKEEASRAISFYNILIEPMSHTREVLRNDRMFARYEAAFMTYGAAWMICEALKPMLITDKLHLSYSQTGFSAFLMFQVGVAVMTLPAGVLMDKLGPARLCTLAFGLYIFYPLGLMFASGADQLAVSSLIYGVCSAMVSAGWMLGPVTLAPSADKVPQYVAIHASMVGLRGTVFQFLGVFVYQLTASFTVSLLLASACFAWASYQMWRLHVLRFSVVK